MELSELQQRVDAWIRQYGVRYFSELTNMAVLTEEVGELARIMARKYGDQSFKEGEKCNLADEMADVLWVLVCLANQTGVTSRQQWKRISPRKPHATKSGTCTIRSSDPEKPPAPANGRRGRSKISATKNRTIRLRRIAPGEPHRTLHGKPPQRVAPKCQPQKIGRSAPGEQPPASRTEPFTGNHRNGSPRSVSHKK